MAGSGSVAKKEKFAMRGANGGWLPCNRNLQPSQHHSNDRTRIMKPKPTLRSFLLAAGSSLLAISSASAQTTYTWDTSATAGVQGGNGTWNTSNTLWTTNAGATNVSWVNAGSAPFNDAIFSGTAGTVTLGEAISLRNLSFTNLAGPYIITGSTLNFTGGTISTVAQTASGNPVAAEIRSNITGSPAINIQPMDGDEVFALNPSAGNTMAIGAVSGDAGNGSERISLSGGAGSSGTIASVTGPKVLVTGGSWTINGASSGRNHEVSAGTLTLNANLNGTLRAVILSGTGVINYNVANAVSASAATNTSTDNGFRITGGTLDNTSGAAINTNASTTHIDLGGNLTFAGTNGAASNLHLGSGVVWLKDGNRQITVTNAATTLTIGGAVINDDTLGRSLTKAGNGTLRLTGNSTYNGVTTITAGTLSVSSINASGGSTPTLTTTANSATVTASSTTGLVVGQTVSSPNIPVGATIATIVNGTTFTLNSGTNVLAGSNAISVIGTPSSLGLASTAATNLVFNGGTLLYTGANATSDRAFTINNGQTATIETTNNLSLVGATGAATTGALTKTGAGTLTLTGASTYTGLTTINAGTLTISNASALGSTAVGGNTTIAYNGSTTTGGRLLLSGDITVAENITITGREGLPGGFAGALGSSSGTNTFSGDITLTGDGAGGGTIRLGTGTTIFSGNITQAGIATNLSLTATTTVNNAININGGALTIAGGGSATLNGVSGSGIGATGIAQDSILTLGITDALNTSNNLNIASFGGADQGTIRLNGFNQTVNGLNSSASGANRIVSNNHASNASTLTVGNGGGNGAFNGTIIDGAAATLALIKTGAGTQTLSGINTYTGATDITGGILHIAVGGSTAAGSAVTVSNSAALVVNGTVNGTLIANANTTVSGIGTVVGAATVSGNLNPGNSIGTLNFTNTLSLAGISNFEIDPTILLGLNADLANVTNGITYGGTLNVLYGGSSSDFANGMIFNLFDGSSFSGSFGTVNLPTLTGGLTWQNNLLTNGTLTVIPEPSAALLGGLGLLLLLRRRR